MAAGSQASTPQLGQRLEKHGAPHRVARHPSAVERAAAGKGARSRVPRSSHAAFEPQAGRPDPVALLEGQAATRVPELVPIRYERMLVSPFSYFRGAALVMASDLASTLGTGITAQLCGDAHASNFGFFASPERRLTFDVNDFDETLPGPWEWDVKRLAASLAVAGRENGFTSRDRRAVALATVREYRGAMTSFAGMGTMDVWSSRADVDDLLPELQRQLDRKRVRSLEKDLGRMRTRDSVHALATLTREVDGEPRIISDPPLIVPIEELYPASTTAEIEGGLRAFLAAYRRSLSSDRRHLLEQFRLVHLARKVVGVGSVGTRAWIGLLLGKDETDPLFLQMKEAEASVLERFVGRSPIANQGERVVAGQRLMQAVSDVFLGWDRATEADGVARDYYVRQLRDWKGSIDPGGLVPAGMTLYGRLCGWTLARAHARSGDRIAIAAYLGTGDVFDRAIAEFSEAYADQNERDYQALQRAAMQGRLRGAKASSPDPAEDGR